ncbi:MAG: uroporphyrinogen decarboxylase family protein [Bacteroidales bacterium]|nr:uroporphyrinogen decarboxylase family protein [Bacteroidales bacterium]
MKHAEMTPMERVLTTLSHKEPDRVPLFLMLTMHGAKELGLSIKEYFSKAENVAEGQKRLQKKYTSDCYYPFFYAPIEVEAFGAEVIYSEDGPPNSGLPVINNISDIKKLEAPRVENTKVLHKVLKSIEILKAESKGNLPIIGVAMSPFSLPVMQLGFEKYLELMHYHLDLFEHLMKINMAFCIDWANAQLAAGATAICYFDPVSSTTIVPKELYYKTGFQVAKQTIAKINGPTATHFASGNCLTLSGLLLQTGTAVVGVSAQENISELKQAFKNKLSVLGNLNGIEMRRWTKEEATNIVKGVIEKAASGGGFILADNHGEIPFQVKDETLLAIKEAVKKYGTYPIQKVQA